jgi:hypothetical protein
MRMTKENKEWMKHAIYLGEDNMHIFDSRWEWISETLLDTPLNQQCIFYQKYVEFGGEDDLSYDNQEALEKAYRYASEKIDECHRELDRRLNLTEE